MRSRKIPQKCDGDHTGARASCPQFLATWLAKETSCFASSADKNVRAPTMRRTAAALILRRDLILLEFSVRHLVGPSAENSLRKAHDVNAQSHAAPESLADLSECLRLSQRSEGARKILQRLIAKVEVRVVSEKCAINLALLKISEDPLGLVEFRWRGRVAGCEQQRRDAARDRTRGARCVLIRQHHDCRAVIRKDDVLRGEA